MSPTSLFPIGHVLLPVRYTLWHNHVCLLLHVLLLVIFAKSSHVPGKIMSVYIPQPPSCWSVWSNRPMFIGTVVHVYHTTLCYWSHRRMFILAQHVILFVSAPHDVSGKSSQEIFKPFLSQPFLFPQPQSFISLQISPELLKPSHPQDISCSFSFTTSLFFRFHTEPALRSAKRTLSSVLELTHPPV